MNNEYIKEQIREYYKREDTVRLAKRLGLTVQNLRKKASRLGIKKEPKTNRVVAGECKLCSKCGEILPLIEFRHDKYQPNGLDYNCKSCRAQAKLNKTVTKTVLNSKNCHKDSSNNSIKFNKSKARNPIVLVNGIESLKCKSCYQIKPLNNFHKDKNNSHGHKNFCKECVKNKKKRS
ncbi:hypothetical protein [Clostridium perfringens]|uniref:hypothetical protein n=1 Tax=Clostridium perfringens TaxID=1502 RepID=UPI0024BC5988|nr:hypothetical protein [Clostridium perfringens]